MTSLIYNQKWIQYKEKCEAEALVEDIWSGKYVQPNLILEAEYQKMLLNEGVGSFFSSAFAAVKSKIEDAAEWADNKMQSFIKASLEKLQDLLQFLRNHGFLKKYQTRRMQDVVGVFKRPEYLKLGSSMILILTQKLAELGAKALLDFMSGGTGTAAKAAIWIQENVEKIKLMLEAIQNFLDPKGLISVLWDFLNGSKFWQENEQTIKNLKDDLEDPHRAFKNAFAALSSSPSP